MSSNTAAELLIKEFADEYLEKIFYFCLRKTGSGTEAEDLTQEIALHVIAELNKGTTPASFPAWVWKLARNRYARWADAKRRRSESTMGEDIGGYAIPDEEEAPVDRMIQREQLSLLRRELAFIRGDYRSILVAHYLEDRRVRDIAASMALSEDTVKQRLCRARKILKEGMNMAREFGTRSYKPEEITFSASGPQPSGLPWSAVMRRIPKNILLQASNNPSTAEELSMELGIALPYMEEEIMRLHDATLLAKTEDGRYITNFFILDKEGQLAIYNTLRKNAKERSRMIAEFIEERLGDIRALGIAADHIHDDNVKWWLVPKTVDYFLLHLSEDMSCYDPPVRANGEKWGFVGYEETLFPEPIYTGHNINNTPTASLAFYKYSDYGLWDQCGETWNTAVPPFFRELMEKKRTVTSLSDAERKLWSEIDGRYAHADENGGVVPDVLVISAEAQKKIDKMLTEHWNYPLLADSFREAADEIREILRGYSHKVLHDSLDFVVHMEIFKARMITVNDLVRSGFLIVPEDTKTSTLGMSLYLK